MPATMPRSELVSRVGPLTLNLDGWQGAMPMFDTGGAAGRSAFLPGPVPPALAASRTLREEQDAAYLASLNVSAPLSVVLNTAAATLILSTAFVDQPPRLSN